MNGTKDDTPPVPLRQDRIINVISSGFKVSRLSYVPGKRSSCHIVLTEVHKTRAHDLEALQIINFHSDESNYRNNPHDDALIISLLIANSLTKWILIDNRSFVNVLFLNAYREMGLKEEDITRRCIFFVGFSSESITTIGETILPVYTEGVNLYTKFLILDSPSTYNVILGQP